MSPKSITINRSILKKQDCNSKTLFTQVTKIHRICNNETSTFVSDSFEPTFSYKKLLLQFPINIPIHFNAFQYATAFSRILDPLDTARKFNVHKTFRIRPGHLLNVLHTFKLRPVSRGWEP